MNIPFAKEALAAVAQFVQLSQAGKVRWQKLDLPGPVPEAETYQTDDTPAGLVTLLVVGPVVEAILTITQKGWIVRCPPEQAKVMLVQARQYCEQNFFRNN